MWILECGGPALETKRIWLRPGKQYLFGRTKPEGHSHTGFVIAHKSVSRKHLTLAVSAVKSGDGSKVHTRSELSLEDENTKVGTEIDGVKVKGERRILRKDEHVFRVGSYEHSFKIKWQPVVLSFTFPSKETKAGKDPLASTRARLEELDIKTTILYMVDETTHVVSSKRNTAKSLQALINGKPIVDNSFIDALVYATTPGNLDELESLSPLEEDFDKNWPRARDHLPPSNKEPNPRPPALFEPDAARLEIFHGYTFIFCDRRQFENLQGPISNGGGKALYYEVETKKTTAADIVRHFKEVSGRKGGTAPLDYRESRDVLIVRFQGEKGYEEWANEVQRAVSLELNRQLIEQNEFLDVILINDPTKLQRTLPSMYGEAEASGAVSSTPSAAPGLQISAGINATTSEQPSDGLAPLRRNRTRGTVKSAFKGFDDGFDFSQLQAQKKSFNANSHNRSHSRDTSQNSDVIMGVESSIEPSHSRSSKRPALSQHYEEGRMDDDLLPATTALKRQRIEEESEARRNGVPVEPFFGAAKSKDIAVKGKNSKPQKEIDIQEVVRGRRKAEEEAAQRDEEDLHHAASEMTVEEMKQLAVIEGMDLPTRDKSNRGANGTDDRWDSRWNGRKNFKKFRRQGEIRPIRRGQTVIVPLEEVKKKSQGIGEQYWLESMTGNRRRRERERREVVEGEEVGEGEARSQSQAFTSAPSHQEEEVPAELAGGSERQVIDVDAPRSTRSGDKRSQVEQGSIRSSATETGKKRSAPSSGRGSSAKRQRTLQTAEDSDSEDELKFRFRKR